MMKAEVYYNQILAGYLQKDHGHYMFRYENDYYQDDTLPPVSLTLPKRQQEYQSATLFSFFFGLLSEGSNKEVQCRLLRIDETDYFRLLIKTAHTETIGAITVREVV